MENLESINNLELLVKIASFGAARVSTLFVGFIGLYIIRIPNEHTHIKASLLKFFMGICAFMVIICGLASWANAYYTHDKVVEANQEANEASQQFQEMGNAYKTELNKVHEKKTALDTELNNIRTQLSASQITQQQINNIKNQLEQTNEDLNGLQMRSFEEVFDEI